MTKIEKGISIRFLMSGTFALVAVYLFILNRNGESEPPPKFHRELDQMAQAIDIEVDGVLENFGIEKAWVRRREINDRENHFLRIERRVAVPPRIVPIMVNRELNVLARRYHGRAVATENLKENSVTIHIILNQRVIQTVILTGETESRKENNEDQLKKI